ncbi:DUF6262 family protein [Streptomyces sp. NPDC088812]|uniref:DUF6262 family protein n=1 Tax=Streptomyces sp. NPDC088812 TaxID=3365905 RepID=UPI0038171C11
MPRDKSTNSQPGAARGPPQNSRDKRARVLHTLDNLLTRGEPVTFTTVAKAAGVSTWLVYAPGVREHIESARAQQARTATTSDEPRSASGARSTRTDLEVLRADNQRLRGQVGDLKEALQASSADNSTSYKPPTSQKESVN